MVQETTTRDHETRGVVVEFGETVGGLGDERAVVGAVTGNRAQSLERHHRSSR